MCYFLVNAANPNPNQPTNQVPSIWQLPANFGAMTVLACKGPQTSLACETDPQVNFLVGSEHNPTYSPTCTIQIHHATSHPSQQQ